jgi:hypothetical protein
VTTASAETAGRFGEYRGRVDADAVFAFARATNDCNDLYVRGEAVPPLFTATLIVPAQPQMQRVAARR